MGARPVFFIGRDLGAADAFAALVAAGAFVGLAVLALFAVFVPFDSSSTALTMGLAAAS